jgi:hypothetical protein
MEMEQKKRPSVYAVIVGKQAYLWDEFGLAFAKRHFTEEKIAELPKFKKGKRVGKIKGQILWQKVEMGGWVRAQNHEGAYLERRVGQCINIKLATADWGDEPQIVAVVKKSLPQTIERLAEMKFEEEKKLAEAEMRDQYRFERAEAQACGYEFPSFEEYRGKALAREIADKRHEERYNNGTEDLY